MITSILFRHYFGVWPWSPRAAEKVKARIEQLRREYLLISEAAELGEPCDKRERKWVHDQVCRLGRLARRYGFAKEVAAQ